MAESIYAIGRVTHVVYGPELEDNTSADPLYNDPTDIGKIEYVLVNSPQSVNVMGAANPVAKAAWPHIKCLPVVGEYVYLIPGPGVYMSEAKDGFELYYLPPFGLWGSPHHNAAPSLTDVSSYYEEIQAPFTDFLQGLPNDPQTDTGVIGVYPLSYTFTEKEDVRALRQFIGDVTLEGRWGNSIRFGSSVATNQSENNWSNSAQDGDPIIIIRNGQGFQAEKRPWYPAVEDISTDKSSIYLTAGQEIIITDIDVKKNFNLTSFGVKFGATQPSIVQSLTPVPISSDQLSPQYQDSQSLKINT